jgi:predicted transcriptional regulator
MAGSVDAGARQRVVDMLRRLPDDVTMEEIAYHVAFVASLEEGIREFDEGGVFTHAEVKERWLNARDQHG